MKRLLLTPPFRYNVAPDVLDWRNELEHILNEYHLCITDNHLAADIELCGNYIYTHKQPWSLPKRQVAIITPEPFQPEYTEAAYIDKGFADILTPINLAVHSRDGFAYFEPPTLPRKQRIFKIDKIALLASFRFHLGLNDNNGVMKVQLNGKCSFSFRLLTWLRSTIGIVIKTHFPDLIDLYGRNWPPGIAVVENSREAEDWRARKLALLSNYGFNLCWENSEIPGYVTEKIWDSIDAGVLPLYWGAPEFHDILPKDSIIDCRQYIVGDGFNIKQLIQDITDMSEEEYSRRINLLYDWHRDIPADTKKTSAIKAAHILGQRLRAL